MKVNAAVAMTHLDEIAGIIYYHVPPEYWEGLERHLAVVRAALSEAGEGERALEAALAREAALKKRVWELERKISEAISALMDERKEGGRA